VLEASREVGREVNTDKTKYMVVSRHQNAGQDHTLLFANKSFENVANFKYLGITITYQYFIHKETTSRLNSGNACYHFIQNLLYSCLLSKT
jgi:hypothetical protein